MSQKRIAYCPAHKFHFCCPDYVSISFTCGPSSAAVSQYGSCYEVLLNLIVVSI